MRVSPFLYNRKKLIRRLKKMAVYFIGGWWLFAKKNQTNINRHMAKLGKLLYNCYGKNLTFCLAFKLETTENTVA
jgi:hypothetical protein